MSKKFTSISTKVYVPLVAILAFIIIVTVLLGFNNVSEIKKDVYEQTKQRIDLFYEQALAEKASVGVSNAITLSFNDNLKTSLIKNDRELAIRTVKDMSKKFKSDTKFQNIQIHIHDKDMKSFVRSWKPEDFGQDLSSFRHTIKEVHASKKAFAAIEVGDKGLSMRGLAPIMDDKGELVGTIEFMQAFMSVVKDAKKDINASTLFLLKDSFASTAKAIANNPKVKNFIIAQDADTIDKDLVAELDKIDISGTKECVVGEKYFVSARPIKDFKGEVIAYLVCGKQIDQINAAIESAKTTAFIQIGLMAGVGIFMVLIIMGIIRKAVKQPITDF
ncbi:MAG: cache domain-containing protein, partial [Campylobacterales bacterium]|nr:cache domain-containing protein [Campylobacterales bacterium]